MHKPIWVCEGDYTGKTCRDETQKDPNTRIGLTGIGEVQIAGYTCKPMPISTSTADIGYLCFVKKR